MWLVMVTPSIFKDVTLRISDSAGGKPTQLERFEQKIISTDFVLFTTVKEMVNYLSRRKCPCAKTLSTSYMVDCCPDKTYPSVDTTL